MPLSIAFRRNSPRDYEDDEPDGEGHGKQKGEETTTCDESTHLGVPPRLCEWDPDLTGESSLRGGDAEESGERETTSVHVSMVHRDVGDVQGRREGTSDEDGVTSVPQVDDDHPVSIVPLGGRRWEGRERKLQLKGDGLCG